jgi:hypothetical protein
MKDLLYRTGETAVRELSALAELLRSAVNPANKVPSWFEQARATRQVRAGAA